MKVMMPVRRARSAWRTRAAADWHLREGARHIRRHPVLSMEQIDNGPRFAATLVLDACEIAETEALELPHDLDAHIITTNPLVQAAVGPEGEKASLDKHAGALEAVEHDNRQVTVESSRGGLGLRPPE